MSDATEFQTVSLDELVLAKKIELGRGEIISKVDIDSCPGPYPIYSSSATANGKFGEYGKYMFDEELISWSVDGGGNFFYRPKHKFSITNVSGYLRIKSEDLTYKFLYYVLAHQHRYIKFDYTTKAHPSVIRKLYRIPDLLKDEQEKITAVLSLIDKTIEKTESLIDKYQQIKAGLMHDLFTRGVTPDGKVRPPREQAPELYKEAPIGWIPKEWDVCTLGKISEVVSGVTLGEKRTLSSGVTVPYLRVANVQDGYLDLSDVKTITVSTLELEKLRLKEGDVLMNEGGDFDKLGRGTVWSGEIRDCVHQNHVFRVRPRGEIIRSNYLTFWSQSEFGKKYFVLSSKQSTNLASINSTQLNAFPIAVPPIHEQERVERRIQAVVAEINSLDNEYDKLNRIKSGLMHDLLTGRVRVKV